MPHTSVVKAAAVAACCLSISGTALANGSDAFNRPTLGPTWATVSGALSISSSTLVGSSLSIGYYKPSAKDTAASAIVALGGTDLEYGAVAIGNIAGGTNAFVKLQAQNGGGTFDHAGFYTGNNSGTQFVTLPAAIPSPAWIDVFFCGTVAHLRITSAAGVTTLTYNYGSSFGAGAGLGTYGSVRLDNFVGFPNTCKAAETTIRAEDLRRDIDLSHPR